MFYYDERVIERLKDLILGLLIILSLVLTFRLWYGYPIHNLFFLNKVEQYKNPDNFYINPKRFIFALSNDGNPVDTWNIVSPGEADYSKIYSSYKTTIKDAFDSENMIKPYKYSKKTMLNLSKQPSLDIDYGCNIDYDIFKGIYGTNGLKDKIKNVREILIVPEFISNSNNKATIYVYDGRKNIYVFQQYSEGIEYIKNYIKSKKQKNSYSELEGTQVEYKIYTPFSNKIKIYNLNTIRNFDNLTRQGVEKLKKLYFSSNPSIVRNYIEASGVYNYFDNEKNLRIYKNGYLEYNYLGSVSGTDNGIYSAYKKAVAFLKSKGDLMQNMYISNIKSKGNGRYFISFDYEYQGIPIEIRNSNCSSAVSIEVMNDTIINYKRYIVGLTVEKNKTYVTDPLDGGGAVDKALRVERQKQSSIKIQDIELCYRLTDKMDKVLKPYWKIKVNNKEYFFSAVKGE